VPDLRSGRTESEEKLILSSDCTDSTANGRFPMTIATTHRISLARVEESKLYGIYHNILYALFFFGELHQYTKAMASHSFILAPSIHLGWGAWVKVVIIFLRRNDASTIKISPRPDAFQPS